MIPDPAKVAHRDARRLALVLEEIGGPGRPIGGGWMACDAPGSWARYAAGLGVERPLTRDEVVELIDFYDQHECPPQVQATPYQHSSVFELLAEHGFTLRDPETVLVRPLSGELPEPATTPALRFVELDPTDADAAKRFVDLHLAGFYPDRDPPAGMKAATERVVGHHRCTLWLVEHEGKPVASGGLEIHENSAVLIAGTTLPAFRRRGVQQAFIRHRLARAAAMHLDYALVGSQCGGPTERNALRAGFVPAYTQLGLWRRRADDRVPMTESRDREPKADDR